MKFIGTIPLRNPTRLHAVGELHPLPVPPCFDWSVWWKRFVDCVAFRGTPAFGEAICGQETYACFDQLVAVSGGERSTSEYLESRMKDAKMNKGRETYNRLQRS